MSIASPLQPGCIVEFLQNNQPVTAWVLDNQESRLRVFTITQREMRLPVSRVLPWTGPQCPAGSSRQDMLELLRTHHGLRERLAEEVDALEIWELAQGELEQAETEWFTSLIFEAPTPDQMAGMGRKLLQTKTHFKFSPPNFEVYPQEIVERREEELRKAQERERLVGFGQVFLRGLWDAFCNRKNTAPQPDEEQAELISTLLMTRIVNPDDRDTETLWRTMSRGLPDDPFLPMYLAQAWNLVPAHFNLHLARAHYDWEPQWEDYAAEIAAVRERVEKMKIAPTAEIVTIDAPSTKDMDDGFSLEVTEDGFLLRQALACPPLGWEFGSKLDNAVQHRFSSLYLPEGTSHMLPAELGTDFFSLTGGTERPALIITFDLDHEGGVRRVVPELGWVRVAANLSFADVDEKLAAGNSAVMNAALRLAGLLREARIRENAVIMEQPDANLSLRGGAEFPEVVVGEPTPMTDAQMIVSEFMILANKAMGAWALEHDVPLVYRTQNITLPAESAGVWSDPVDIFRIINSMGPSILECEPRLHATIGATAYAPLTSPLRRYSDFINMAQVLAALTGTGRLLDRSELEALLPFLSARAEAVGQVQRMRVRYWKYEYFRQNYKKMHWSGVLVDAGPVLVTIALPDVQLFLKAPRRIFGDKFHPGQRFAVRVGKVDPLAGEIRIAEAWEE